MNKKTAALLLFVLATTLTARDSEPLRRVEARDVTAADLASRPRNGRNIFLRTAIFDPATERPDYEAVGLAKETRAIGEYAIVQFRSNDPASRAELERLGVKFFGYMPDNAFQVRIPRAMRSKVAGLAAVRWVGEYEPGFKVHPRLWATSKEAKSAIRVVPFRDASVDKTIMLLKRSFPTLVVTKKFDNYARFVELIAPFGQEDEFVQAAAALDGVAWIEPNDQAKFHNANSSGAIQNGDSTAAGRTIWAHNITGTGQIIAVADSGLDDDMCFFRTLNGREAVTDATIATTDVPGPLFPQNKVIAYWVQEDADAYDSDTHGYHGTHTAGTVAGDNLAHPSSPTDGGFDQADGMAPNAQILFQDIGKDGATGLGGGDPYAMFLQALRGGARLHSNSYGRSANGSYTAYEQLVDQFLFDHDEMSIFFSAGNDGDSEPIGGPSIGNPAAAKNVVTVGAVGIGTSNVVAGFSSRGPTADGRVKPDIVAPGVSINSAFGDSTRGNNNCTTSTKRGTSMSCPTVAGGAALLRQYFADGYYPTGTKTASNTVNASAPLVKGVLLNGASHAMSNSFFGTADFGSKYGWGKILLDSNLYFPGDARRMRVWDLPNTHGLLTGESRSFTVSVATGQEFRATLVWTDPEAALGAAKALVNDLDLVVTRGGDTLLGNVFGTTGESAAGGSADRVNNVEQVRLAAPTGGTYTITVRGHNVPGNGRSATNRQGFALVVSSAGCTTSIASAPSNLSVKASAAQGNDLTWTPASGSAITQVYRAEGANPAAGDFRYIGTATGNSFTDVRAQGGFTYTYKVRGADDCGEGPVSNSVTFASSGRCDLAPQFSGIAAASADPANTCRITLSWGAGTSSCPLSPGVIYNVYRSTDPDFIPSGTPYASTSARTFDDLNVVSGTTYHYIIRAEDLSKASSGPHNGNEETNLRRLFATSVGAPGAKGTWTDSAGDGGAFMSAEVPWQINRQFAKTGTHSYHHGPDFSPYPNLTCAAIVTPALSLDANAELSYFARYSLEFQWDGVIVEISTDGGNTWADLPPAGGYPDTLAETQGDSGTEPPVNVCGYPKTKGAFTGPANKLLTEWTRYTSSLSAFAGQTVKIRWRFTSDPATENEGFFLDDVAITNVKLPGSCTPVNQGPDAAFSHLPGVGTRGVPVQFTDNSLNSPTSWLWEFGDGNTSTQRNPTHTYAAAGTYNVKLTVTNAHGSDSLTKVIKVNEPGQAPSKRRSARH